MAADPRPSRVLPTICERCDERRATMLLGKGIVVCNPCYESPEDVIRDLPRPHDDAA